ncbi:MAG: DinB family protein [Planctomycetes bacterium]|nr:DinB family protein [Planctomycetota bacterium]
MDLPYFRKLFEYDDWANAGHLDGLIKAAAPAALKAMAHLLAAREIWLLRVKNESTEGRKFFRRLDAAGCRALHEHVSADWRAWLNAATPADLDAQVTFHDSFGNPYTLTRRVMLTHVLLHSAHHRGQVAMAQRQAGYEPTDLDLYLSPLVQEKGSGPEGA